jgi:hypothetical protein
MEERPSDQEEMDRKESELANEREEHLRRTAGDPNFNLESSSEEWDNEGENDS